jgi:hypothetical protein
MIFTPSHVTDQPRRPAAGGARVQNLSKIKGLYEAARLARAALSAKPS